MFNSKAKGGNAVPSDAQAREKLALYVYEYLLHVGAQKSAETFLRYDLALLRLDLRFASETRA
jgi:hypothetical protein